MVEDDTTTTAALREELKTRFDYDCSAHGDAELRAFQLIHKDRAAEAIAHAAKWKKEHSITIADISPFLRAPPTGSPFPDGCSVLLEDGRGGVARDVQGRPVVLCIGMMHGTAEDLCRQSAYLHNRAALYCKEPFAPGEAFAVHEFKPRHYKNKSTFRIPDSNFRVALDFMKLCFPGSQLIENHFCGLPRIIIAGFNLATTFLSAETTRRIQLKSSFSHLKGRYITPENMLKEWDPEGTFDFDLDEYIEWRAREEGVEDAVCPRGQGRSYDGPSASDMVSSQDLLGTEHARSLIVTHGPVQKQGSGVGMFASSRWKEKLLVLTKAHLLVYFDSNDVTSNNKATKTIQLAAGDTAEPIVINSKGISGGIQLRAMKRDFTFGFYTAQEQSRWLEALTESIASITA